MGTGVWQKQLRARYRLIPKGNQIQIQHSGLIDHTTALTAEIQLNDLQFFQQAQGCFVFQRHNRRHSINKNGRAGRTVNRITLPE